MRVLPCVPLPSNPLDAGKRPAHSEEGRHVFYALIRVMFHRFHSANVLSAFTKLLSHFSSCLAKFVRFVETLYE